MSTTQEAYQLAALALLLKRVRMLMGKTEAPPISYQLPCTSLSSFHAAAATSPVVCQCLWRYTVVAGRSTPTAPKPHSISPALAATNSQTRLRICMRRAPCCSGCTLLLKKKPLADRIQTPVHHAAHPSGCCCVLETERITPPIMLSESRCNFW
jgi:hypothetical protein